MNKQINSVSFHEDFVQWADVILDESNIVIRRAVSDSLPLIIDHKSLNQTESINQISKKLVTLIEQNSFSKEKVRFTFPSKFSLIKKIALDSTISSENYNEFIFFELEKIWEEPSENYQIYQLEKVEASEGLTEILILAVRKKVIQYFQDIAEFSGLELDVLTPSCFTVDELYRQLYPDAKGQTLIIGWQRRGYDIIISTPEQFIHYDFKPYNTDLNTIEQIDEEYLLSSFDLLLDEIQSPPVLDRSLFNIKTIVFYGYHFKAEWLDIIQAQVQLPIKLFNVDTNSAFQLKIQDALLSAENIFQFVEPISNIF